jgi:hypothetical protein
MHPNQTQAESYHAGLAEGPPTEIEPAEPEPRYFEAMAWFDSPDDAEEAKEALAAAGYAFETTPYVFDESARWLLARQRSATIRPAQRFPTLAPERKMKHQSLLIQIGFNCQSDDLLLPTRQTR